MSKLNNFMKVEIVGLPVTESKLVTKVNAETVIWQELISSGAVASALGFYQCGSSAGASSDLNLLKMLSDAAEREIRPHERFAVQFAEQWLEKGPADEGSPSSTFWRAVTLMAKTSQWRRVVDRVAGVRIEQVQLSVF